MISAKTAREKVERLELDSYSETVKKIEKEIEKAISEKKDRVDIRLHISSKILKELRDLGYQVLEIPSVGGTVYKVIWKNKISL